MTPDKNYVAGSVICYRNGRKSLKCGLRNTQALSSAICSLEMSSRKIQALDRCAKEEIGSMSSCDPEYACYLETAR